MKLEFNIGEKEIKTLCIERNWFTGKFIYVVNGVSYELRSPADLGTHYTFKLTHNYTFEIGTLEKHTIEIKHKRPIFFAGFRPQFFEVKIDGEVRKQYKGY